MTPNKIPQELKTLKDLGFKKIIATEDIFKGKSYNQKVWVDFEEYGKELKAEAIKRAKLYTHKANLKGIEDDEIKYWTARRVEVMEFNNLTEEDLK